jgi:hypothetical protein
MGTNVRGEKEADGIAARIGALWSPSTVPVFQNIFISLFFILLNCLPIAVKLLSERGCYDEISDEKGEKARKTAKQKSDSDIQKNEEVLKKIAEHQKDLALLALDKWKAEQEATINPNNVTT